MQKNAVYLDVAMIISVFQEKARITDKKKASDGKKTASLAKKSR